MHEVLPSYYDNAATKINILNLAPGDVNRKTLLSIGTSIINKDNLFTIL